MTVTSPNPTPRLHLLLSACLALAACSADDSAERSDDVGSVPDADGGIDATMADTAGVLGEFEIGTNNLSNATADGFVPMIDGAEVPWTFGVQGSWMVVLAFRTHDMFEGPFEVHARISLDGVDSGEIWLEDQETFAGGDGWDYYFSLFLPLDDQPPEQGSPVHIEMEVTDGAGTTAARAHDVVGGPTVD